MRELTRGIDVVFHQAAIRITQCAEEPRLALEVLVDGTFNVVEAAAAGGRAQGRRRVVGLGLRAGRGVPDHARTTTRTPTTRSTARPRSSTRACCAASTRCTASTTSRCATSTSTARGWTSTASTPRCSSAGWSASTAGEPPLIFGDGAQTMDFVYVDDIARANILAAERRRHRRGLQRRQRRRDEPARARRGAAARSWAPTSSVEHGPDARRQRRHPPPGRHERRARAPRLRGRGRPRRGPARAWSTGGAPSAPARRRAALAKAALMEVPFARPYARRRTRRQAVAEAIASGWVAQGPRVAAFEAAFAERVGAADAVATTNCTTALHLALLRVGRRPRRRGHRPVAVVHRHRQRGLAVRRDAGLRRHRPADLQPRPGVGRARDHRSARRRSCPCTRSGCRPTWTPSSRSPSATGSRSSRTPPARSARSYKGRPIGSLGPLACFSLHPRKVITTGEGGMIAVHDPAVAERLRTPAPARDGPVGPRAPRREGRRLRGLSRARLQLPHDRHAGGARAVPARGPRRHPGRAHAPGRALHRRARAHPAPRRALRARVRVAHLAVLLRARGRPLARRADRAHAPAAARRHRHAPRRDGDPPGAVLRRAPARPAAAHRGGRRAT